jgi:Kef-type K+ transport system membrane component KefB
MPDFSNSLASFFQKRAVAAPGGVFSGIDPIAFSTGDPLRLWIIQLGIIVCTASLLSLVLSRLSQPKVIAEVLGGIILGPTVFGRVPGFTEHVFPPASIPYLSLVASIGLCLFLFLVGLEIDAGVIKRNTRLSAIVALAGMILPFGIGGGLSVAIYKEFISPNVQFAHFMLFIGVAYSITAFPVLCRILTELKLLDTTVGVVVLSAGIGNDIVGWILLALTVALVNAGSGLTAVYILLTCIGWAIFILFPVKFALKWLAKKTGSIETGPSVFFMTVTIIILFGSAFFTNIIGVHAIFGAFLAGLIVPREGGLAIAITEKLEDMVSVIFLPLYFTLSGLSTDLGLLNNGITWAYTILIILTAFVSKFGGCTIAARYSSGFNWRESGAIGSLMSCKGLVELVVLNVGLSAGILSQRVFSIFVLQALVLTFMTTPLVKWLYPPHLRRRDAASGLNFRDRPDKEATARSQRVAKFGADEDLKTRFTVVLDKLEHLPAVMALTQLVQPPVSESLSVYTQKDDLPSSITTEALRLIELSDRVSAVMKSSISNSLLLTDPMLSIFRMFGHLNGIKVSSALSVVKFDDLAYSVVEHARNRDSDMILIPWLPPLCALDGYSTPTASVDADQTLLAPPITPIPTTDTNTSGFRSHFSNSAFDMLFKTSGGGVTSARDSGGDSSTSVSSIHSQFVRGVLSQSKTDVALFVDQCTPDSTSILGSGDGVGVLLQHVFLPFFGGPDDRLALDFVVQICANPRVRGTIVRITKCDEIATGTREAQSGSLTPEKAGERLEPNKIEEFDQLTVGSVGSRLSDSNTVYGPQNTEIKMQSDTADNIAWARYAPGSISNAKLSPSLDTSSLASSENHVEFKCLLTPRPLHAAIQEATAVAVSSPACKLVVVTGRSRRLAGENHRAELKTLMDEHGHVGAEVRKTVGDVATVFMVEGVGSGIVVVQTAANL